MRLREEIGVVAAFRRFLLGDQRAQLARMERELAEIRGLLRDPSVLRPLVVEALGAAAAEAPEEVARALEPALGQRRRPPVPREPRRGSVSRIPRWGVAAGVFSALILAQGQGEMHPAGVNQAIRAANADPGRGTSSDVALQSRGAEQDGAVVASGPVIVDESGRVFGMGEAGIGDSELVAEVRARLAGCEQLAGSEVSLAVKDGWVWLRGEVSSEARDAAVESLANLGDRVLVVNQLVVAPPPDMLAER